MTADERRCWCGESLAGRRPDAITCSPKCKIAASKRRRAAAAESQPGPGTSAAPAAPPASVEMRESWIGAQALAAHLDLSVRSIDRAVAAGMPCVQRVPRGGRRFSISDCEAWLQARVAKKSASAQLRTASCVACGFTIMLARKWLEAGLPTCSCSGEFACEDPADQALTGGDGPDE